MLFIVLLPFVVHLDHFTHLFNLVLSFPNIIRQLLVQAKPEDFPNSSHMRAAEPRAQPAQRDHSGKDRKSKP